LRRAPEDRWEGHDAAWRDPAQVISQWAGADATDARLLHATASGRWWETLAATGLTLLVTREYEHLVVALRVSEQGPAVSHLPLPHPSGLAVDAARGLVHVASTRNPNQVYDLAPVTHLLRRTDVRGEPVVDRPLVPIRSRFYPGCLYLHDLALVDGALHAAAAGQNCVVRLDDDGRYEPVWWPRCIEADTGPVFDRNHLQLNSIAAGAALASSYFTASTDRLGRRRPGHENFAVDRRGVIFSGQTREVLARGLTRPHSARLHADRLWVDNSGYGEVGIVDGQRFEPQARLPGWTRGLFFHGSIAFVGTSRVIPRFRQYAPGLAVSESVCGIHALDTRSGQVVGSLVWPDGNQVFAVEGLPSALALGFPFRAGARRATQRGKTLFYAFATARAADR
jgi:uncharacterized protein (TIGR03032 family)